MLISRRVLLALGLFFLCTPFLYAQETNFSLENSISCINDQSIVSLTQDDIHQITPCSSLGAAYVLGIEGNARSEIINVLYGDALLFERHPVYASVRLYLFGRISDQDSEQWKPDRFTDLALASAHHARPGSGISADKSEYYSSFILLEYWAMNESTLSGSSKSALAETIQLFLLDSPLGTTGELRCFIKHDFPALTFNDVIASDGYHYCINGGEVEE